MEAYKVDTSLNITGNAHKRIIEIADRFKAAAVDARMFQKTLDTLEKSLKHFAVVVRETNPEMRLFNKTFGRLNSNILITQSRTRSLIQTFRTLNDITSMAQHNAKLLSENLLVPRAVLGGGGGSGNGTRRYTRHGFIGGAAEAVGMLGLTRLTAAGAAGYGVAKSFMAGSEYQQNMQQLLGQNLAGTSQEGVEQYLKQNSTNRVGKLRLLTALTDAASITKNIKEAEALGPGMALIEYVQSALYKGSDVKIGRQQQMAAVKTAEIVTGSREKATLQPVIEGMFRTILSSGGRVKPTDYLGVAKTLRGHAMGMDTDFFLYMLEPMIQEYQFKIGTMLSQFFGHMQAGRLTTAAAKQMEKAGLADKKMIEYYPSGRFKRILPGGIKGQELMSKNPFAWMEQYLIPAMQKMGIKDLRGQERFASTIFTNTDLGLVNTFLQQINKLHYNFEQNKKTYGVQHMAGVSDKMNAGQLDQTTQALSNFMIAISNLTSPTIILGLKLFTNLLNMLTKNINLFASALTPGGASLSHHGDLNLLSTIHDVVGNALNMPISKQRQGGDVYLGIEKVGKVISKWFAKEFDSGGNQHGMTTFNASVNQTPTTFTFPGGI